jgi:NADH:ubiquinone oxidoreductase subunit 5 (subunit L)/multisubunit Na+/H+ antiporter MnhA subunit
MEIWRAESGADNAFFTRHWSGAMLVLGVVSLFAPSGSAVARRTVQPLHPSGRRKSSFDLPAS